MKNSKSGKLLVCGAQQPKKMGRESVNAITLLFLGGEPSTKYMRLGTVNENPISILGHGIIHKSCF